MTVEFLTLEMSSLYALMFVVLIGLPHGAFDGAIATHLSAKKSGFTSIKFFAYYCFTTFLVVALWVALPGVMLGLFLIISMIHFGWGDTINRSGITFFVQVIVHGGMPIFGIVYFHNAEVAPIFNILTFGAPYIALQLSELAAPIIMALVVVYAGLALQNRLLRWRFAELLAITALIALLPPLVGFAFYFCFIHTSRHMRKIWLVLSSATSSKALIKQATVYTIGSWCFGAVAFFSIGNGNIHAELVQIIFIGLAALTVPHMILVDGFFRAKEKGHKS